MYAYHSVIVQMYALDARRLFWASRKRKIKENGISSNVEGV